MDDPVLDVVTHVGRLRPVTHLLDNCTTLLDAGRGNPRLRPGTVTLSELATGRTCQTCVGPLQRVARRWRDLPDDDSHWIVATWRHGRLDGMVSPLTTAYALLSGRPNVAAGSRRTSHHRLWLVPARLALAFGGYDSEEFVIEGPLHDPDELPMVAALHADGEMDLATCLRVIAATRS